MLIRTPHESDVVAGPIWSYRCPSLFQSYCFGELSNERPKFKFFFFEILDNEFGNNICVKKLNRKSLIIRHFRRLQRQQLLHCGRSRRVVRRILVQVDRNQLWLITEIVMEIQVKFLKFFFYIKFWQLFRVSVPNSTSADQLDQIDAHSQHGSSDAGSSTAEPNYKLFVKPSQKSNRSLILNALQYSVFPGEVNKEAKQKVLEVSKFVKILVFGTLSDR